MTFIIAEVGVNHNGSIDIAKQLVDLAKDAGANAVKFQTFKTDKLVSKDAKKASYQENGTDETQGEMLQKYELTYDQFREIKEYCDSIDIEFISTPFDNESVDLLNSLDVGYFKIGSGDLTNYPLLRKVAETNKRIILSTGMSDVKEVKDALDFIDLCGYNNTLFILHCVSCYPTKLEDTNLLCLEELSSLSPYVGFSDHTTGWLASVVAVSCGATVIEKHFTLDKNMEGPDHKASLDGPELCEFIKMIRDTEKALGTGVKSCRKDEIEVKKVARRSLAFNRDMKKGDTITYSDLIGLRPYTGICCSKYMNYVGKVLKRDVKENEFLLITDI